MSKSKKGLSFEDKKQRLLEIFYEKKEVFLLKELERIAPKEKSIVMQSVKDVLQALVADDLVDSDKIGSSVYFWSFPSKAFNTRSQKISELQNKIQDIKEKLKCLSNELKKVEISDNEIEMRDKALQQLKALEKHRNELKNKLQLMKQCDPELFAQMEKDCLLSKEAINRWTDNVFLVKNWCKKKFSLEDSVINKQFNIPEDFDYTE